MLRIKYDKNDLDYEFSAKTLARGQEYQRAGNVIKLEVSKNAMEISSVVRGIGENIYKTNIKILLISGAVAIEGMCSCPVGYNCKHVAATLLELLEHENNPLSSLHEKVINEEQNYEIARWLNTFKKNLNSDEIKKDFTTKKTDHRLIYLLKVFIHPKFCVAVRPALVRVLRNGGYGVTNSFSFTAPSHQRYLNESDEEILSRLEYERRRKDRYASDENFELVGKLGSELLGRLLATGRCHNDSRNPALQFGEVKKLDYSWVTENDGTQRLVSNLVNDTKIIPLEPCWYLNTSQNLCGKLVTDLSIAEIKFCCSAPEITPSHMQKVRSQIVNLSNRLPLPNEYMQKINEQIIPVPKLRFLTIEANEEISNWQHIRIRLPVIELSFDYHGTCVPWHNPKATVYNFDGEILNAIPRGRAYEKGVVEILEEKLKLLKVGMMEGISVESQYAYTWYISKGEKDSDLDFMLYVLPELKNLGWQVEIAENFLYQIVDEEEVQWYSEIEESQYDWFNFALGIKINDQNINLLPLLVKVLTASNGQQIKQFSDNEKLLFNLPDGKLLPVPVERVRGIVNVLTELYDSECLNASGHLELSQLRVAQLFELEKTMRAAKMRWLGGEKLRMLGRKLSNFKGIEKVEVPAGFKTELRPYQQEGLNWLQFLRKYELAGILADDMGLGKTVQTLAHVLVEKTQKRIKKPSLIIMPTSLIFNWKVEAKRFAPQLKVLSLHGPHRHRNFAKLNDYDLLLTTYPLLVRDKGLLIKQEYYYLILDEAQMVKNYKAKAAQVVHHLQAQHRLCLTGTPLENHLGELWSLMHFLMPGLLGDNRQFKKLFRNPIEKNNDIDRRLCLAKRIKPFIVRRVKQDVFKELPEKTEIVRNIELEGAQRDLYEGIRLAMHDRIKQQIKTKGLSRSHIVILDALLKLRQVCCDPRLLKLDSAKKAHNVSKKKEFLMDILPSLIDEGNRILLFSQFTSMLELIEEELRIKNIEYVKLTGDTKDRETPIMRFQANEVPLFLISLKAGGLGLNLTAADTVIHYDPWWNPAVEVQATDRAHRIGQKKKVFVYKLIASGTVEEVILQMQVKKRNLMNSLFTNTGNSKTTLTAEDVEQLLRPLE